MSEETLNEIVARLDKLSEMVHMLIEHVTKKTPTQEALELRDLIRSIPAYAGCTVYPARQGAQHVAEADGRKLYKIETLVPMNQIHRGVFLISGFYKDGAIRASADYIRKWVEQQRAAAAPVDVEATQHAEAHDDLDPTF